MATRIEAPRDKVVMVSKIDGDTRTIQFFRTLDTPKWVGWTKQFVNIVKANRWQQEHQSDKKSPGLYRVRCKEG